MKRSRERIRIWGIICVVTLGVLGMAATWPWQKPQKDVPSESETEIIKDVQVEEENSLVLSDPTGKEKAKVREIVNTEFGQGESSRRVAGPPRIGRIPKIPSIPRVMGVPGSVKAAIQARRVSSVSIVQVKKRLQEIMRLNDSYKKQYQQQAVMIRKIQEQARIHKRILEDLETARAGRDQGLGMGTEELIRREKLRLIHDHTEKNYAFIDRLKSKESDSAAN